MIFGQRDSACDVISFCQAEQAVDLFACIVANNTLIVCNCNRPLSLRGKRSCTKRSVPVRSFPEQSEWFDAF